MDIKTNKNPFNSKKTFYYLSNILTVVSLVLIAFSGSAIYFLTPYNTPEWIFFTFLSSMGVFTLCVAYLSSIGGNHNNHDKNGMNNVDSTQNIKNIKEVEDLTQKLKTMEEQSKYFTDLKTAMLNIMEDLDLEKKNLGIEKTKDEAILASMGEGLIATNSHGSIELVNKAAADMLDYSIKEFDGKRFTDIIKVIDEKGEAVVFEKTPINTSLVTGRKFTGDNFTYYRKDGKGISVGVTVSPIFLNDKIIGAIEVFRDVTREKQVDKMKTEFISLASHQLRTPLSAMKWFLEMLLHGDAGTMTTEQTEMITNVNLSNERMIALVNSLLNISRIESGRIIIEPTPTDLGALVKDVVDELKQKIEERRHSVVVSMNPNIPKINIDPKLVRHVYMNLLTNAIKYTPKGGEIIVMISRKDNEVISQVSDNGYGIPANEHSKIFQKFYRAENVIKIETEGTGLGLYLAKAIVESSGGKIWFESEKDKGTTFWFSLPEGGSAAKKGEVSLDTSRSIN